MAGVDDSDNPRGTEDDCAGPDLSSLPKAMKALAAAARLIKAGRMPPERAGTYVNALTSLIKAYQDRRDSLWTKRAAVLWEEREQHKQPEAH